MIYRRVECPHCGNEITVKSIPEPQKCQWCRRLVGAKFTKRGKKFHCEVEAMDFPKEQKFEYGKRNYNDWKRDEIYGVRH